MSRDFNGSTSKITIPYNLGGSCPPAPVTLSVWVRVDTLKVCGIVQTNKGNATHRGTWINMNDTSGHIDIGYGSDFGTGSNSRQSKVSTGTVGAGAWHHIVACIRGPANMDIYIDGSDAGGSYSGSGGSLAYNAASVGALGASAGTANYDGLIAEVAQWGGLSLSAAEALALSRGASPLMIQPEHLSSYWPLWGAGDPELDISYVDPTILGTITSAPQANHAPVGCPFPLAA